MSRKYLTSPPEQTTMPGGIPYIVGNEAAERFSFYGMKTLLAIFMTAHLFTAAGQPDNMSDAQASEWVHRFVAATYFLSFVGGIVSDWLFGKYRTILYLSCVYCLGHGVLALMDADVGLDDRTLLLIGLSLIALGAGSIKSCVSAHVGDQFGAGNQHLLPRVYSWFYFSINFGAAISTLLTPWLAKHYGYAWGFGVPGILMALATIVFFAGRNKFVHIPPAGEKFFEQTFSKEGVSAVMMLVPLYLFIAMFWALFDQTSSRWVLQARDMNLRILPSSWDVVIGPMIIQMRLSPEQFQAANPLLILMLIPAFAYGVYPFLGKFFTVTPLRKIGLGLFLMIPAFIVPAFIQQWIDAGQAPSIFWQLLAYVLITSAEVMVSITSLEFTYTQAPNKMKSFIMGVYWLSVFAGNGFTAIVNGIIDRSERSGNAVLQGASYYWFFTGCMAVTACVYLAWAPFYKGRTYIQNTAEQAAAEGG